MLNRFHSTLFIGLVSLGMVVSACSRDSKDQGGDNPQVQSPEETNDTNPAAPTIDDPKVTVVPAGDLPVTSDDGERIELPGGDFVAVTMVGGVPYIQVEATFSDPSFKRLMSSAVAFATNDAERIAHMNQPMVDTIAALKKHATLSQVKKFPEYGYFKALMSLESYRGLQEQPLKLPNTLIINPVIVNPLDQRSIRKMDAELLETLSDNASLSGLHRIGVPEFLKQMKRELGVTPDGSRVKVGVTDTGITFNHPSFYNDDNKNRIVYMRDFTGEGRAYFNPAAQFEVKEVNGSLSLTAEYVPSVVGSTTQPVADEMKVLADKELLVSKSLRKKLLTPNSGAKLGLISEKSFENGAEKVDINFNGKSDDTFYAILLPKGSSYEIYLSPVGNLDFRKVTPVGDWVKSKKTLSWGSEKFGLDIRKMKLKDSTGADIDVLSASIVGFDPGNHGSHVSGIIGGTKTIANDRNDTLARGVAPNSQLMMNRVCANNGGCVSTEAYIDLVDNGAEMVNMSLGGLSQFNDGYSVSEVIINRLTEQKNVLFIISAGNSGPGINTTGSPSNAKYALSVGATATNKMIETQYRWPGKGTLDGDDTEERDFMMFFSSRGPNAAGGFKPNVSAPGTELSAVQLNTATGSRAGLDVYWGTSMAAPTATGAIALLLDAVKIYNEKHADAPLLSDSLTLRQVIIDSARPFDVTRFDPKTGEFTRGQYTWIDQGTGMIDLPRAWEALKVVSAASPVAPSVVAETNGKVEAIKLEYTPRVLRTNPNGINYDGSRQLAPQVLAMTGPAFGKGIWLDAKGTDSLINVQLARRLPFSATLRPDVGELRRQLVTTQDTFVFDVVYYGSNKEWLKVGTLDQLDCSKSPENSVTVIGEGATDQLTETGGASNGLRTSNINVCVNRRLLSKLPAGDHGALIRGYRTDGENTEVQASFVIPVYMTQPNKTLAGHAGYKIDQTVDSLAVRRHYVNIPEGTSLVTVRLEVPEAVVGNGEVSGCMGVRLYAAEAGNSAAPQELAGNNSIALNCSPAGEATPGTRTISYSRTNPKAGVWDLHVFGRYWFAKSAYTLTVDYAKVDISKKEIVGPPAALTDSLTFEVLESSIEASPSAKTTTLSLEGFSSEVAGQIKTGEMQQVPDAEGKVYRQYPKDITAVSIKTSGSPGNDLDLFVLECGDESETDCALAASGTSPTDEETATFLPKQGKFYLAIVMGYAVEAGDGSYLLSEVQVLEKSESATISISQQDGVLYEISYAFDVANSTLLAHPLFLTGKFSVVGSLVVRTETGDVMTSVPVKITQPQP